MGLKKYIFGSLILVLAIFGYVFSIESGDYRVQILDFSLVLPIAAWVVAPLVILIALTILHISYYGLKNFFSLKAVSKDSESFIKLIKAKLLKENINIVFTNEKFKELNSIVKQLDLDVTNSDFSSENKLISKTVDQIISINSGRYISSKELKLDPSSIINEKNTINRINADDNYALEVVKKSSTYSSAVAKAAFSKVIETKSITTIKKHLDDIVFDKEMLMMLFKKDSEQKTEFAMTNDMILKLISKVELSFSDLIDVAKIYKSTMSPDQILNLFEQVSTANEEFTSAYLYVLSEYEMIDKMRDILVNSQTHEFIPFKALVDLKDAGKHTYSLDTLCFK